MKKLISKFDEFINEGKDYYRLPEKVIDTTMYNLASAVNALNDTLRAGNDFNKQTWDSIKIAIKEIDKKIQKNPKK